MNREIPVVDRISDLPDFVLHRIIYFLPRKDANQTCVLSKRWRFIWDTFPIFDFDQNVYIQNSPDLTLEYEEKTRKLIKVVDKSLRKFASYKLSMERLFLELPLFDANYFSMVDQWVSLALDSGVRELSILVCDANEDVTYTETAFAARSISGSFKLGRLQKLSLAWVRLSENVVQNIVRLCPNLSDLCLMNICGLKTLEISKLDKLEKLRIISTGSMRDLQSVNIDAPNLKHLSFDPRQRQPCSINFTSCHDLKELHLGSYGITDDLLHLYLSSFPLLEVLDIFNCDMLRKVEISSQQLRSLRLLLGCTEFERIQVDAPILSSFEFTAYHMPALFLENVSCLLKISYIVSDRVADSSWFSQLREFLGHLSQRKFLTLKFHKIEINFDLEELGEEEIPPLVEIDHLKLTSLSNRASVDCAALIDGMFWSCHPKILSIPSNSMVTKDCIKVLCEKLWDRECPSCCVSSTMKCWHHYLKDARIERFSWIGDEQQLLHPNLLLDTLPSLEKHHEVRFKLEWDFLESRK
ncbi:hypothetical protein TIFTF001_006485 [Ficus carica]|uniref:F-box domain-containing protein n=1 Tax=Ficus carica TaxID=3494 RepID=A0AA87ZHK5_FICCA|nr:hypothetical protein TIFTF001_006485 [Ficus carica]